MAENETPATPAPVEKPGIKTTEFWVSLVMGAVGVYLTTKPGLEEIGAFLVFMSGTGYTASRSYVKRPARVG